MASPNGNAHSNGHALAHAHAHSLSQSQTNVNVNGTASLHSTPMPLSPATHVSTTSSIHTSSSTSHRRAFLDESALSPSEYAVYTASFASIRPAPSGHPGLIDESDALRYLRDDCSMAMEDELEILSLFERTPRGLASGHFYAMLRLVSWAQQGHTATKQLLFTQTAPVRITHQKTTPHTPSVATFSSPQSIVSPTPRSHTARLASAAGAAPSTSTPKLPPPPPKPDVHSKPLLPAVREETPNSTAAVNASAAPSLHAQLAPSGHPPAVPAKPSMPNLVAPRAKHAMQPMNLEDVRKPVSMPTPSATANPFRDGATSAHGYVPSTTPASIPPVPTGALLGFDPAPNPFKQTKPRIVKPTPVRASSPASNPFRNGTPAVAASRIGIHDNEDARSSAASSSRSNRDRLGASSPPLPPRPHLLNPPPLPPRHISPLIQAGLNARSEVRRAKQALPPKTFTVLQSSSSKHVAPEQKPRLLTGQTAPPEILPPPPQHHAKRRSVSGSKAFADPSGAEHAGSFVSEHEDATGPASSKRRGSALTGAGDSDLSAKAVQPLKTVAPKPSYPYPKPGSDKASTKSGTLPSWLREQEELQREALASGEHPPAPPPLQEESEPQHAASPEPEQEQAQARTVLDELDDEAQAMNPFFPPDDSRPLGRSKTLGARLPPPRRRPDWGATLESGTYAGAKPNREVVNSGGLRLVPPSKQARLPDGSLDGIRPAEGDLPAPLPPSKGIRERVSDILRLQEAPPKGQRPVDMLGQDIASLIRKIEDPPQPDTTATAAAAAAPRRSASYSAAPPHNTGHVHRRWSSYAATRPGAGAGAGAHLVHDNALDEEEDESQEDVRNQPGWTQLS